MKRQTWSDMEYSNRKKKTKREEFLGIIRPYYPEGKRGRPPIALELMLRMYLLQCWFNLSDLGHGGRNLRQLRHAKVFGTQFYDGQCAGRNNAVQFPAFVGGIRAEQAVF